MRFVLAALIAVAGCGGPECGEGTFSNGNDCVGYDPNDKTPPVVTVTPPGGRNRDPLPSTVMLATDEPALIFTTTDGSEPDPAGVGETSPVLVAGITYGMTIKYVAVDRAGNQSAGTETYVPDAVPPPQVSNLEVMIAGTNATVTWKNPTDTPDYIGTVLARVTDVIDASPPAGQLVTAPMALSPSVQILSVGNGTSFVDSGRPPGPSRYVAWTYDDLGNYSAPVAVTGQIPIGSLAGRFTFNTTNSMFAIAQSPANLALTGSSASLTGTTLVVTLMVKNNTAQYFLNPKIEVTGVSNGTLAAQDGTADGRPFRTLGPNAFAPNVVATQSLVFNVTAGATVTVDFEIASHASMIATADKPKTQLVDLGSGILLPVLDSQSRGPNDRIGGRPRPPVLTGGHYLDLPTNHGVTRFDLVTGMPPVNVPLVTGDRGSVQFVVSNGAELIALVKQTGRRRVGTAELVKLDEGLHIVQRLQLPYTDERGFARPAISADGKTIAVPLTGVIVLVDVATMQLIDPIPSTPVIEAISPGVNGRLRSVVFFNGTDGMVVLARNGGQASIIKRSPESYQTTLYQDADAGAKGFAAALGPDDRIWLAFASGIRAYDPVTDVVSPVAYTSPVHGLSMVEGQMWIIQSNADGALSRRTLDQVNASGAVQRTINLPVGTFGHWLSSVR